MNEIAIRGGTLVDGTGSAGVRADIGISNGRIAEIGQNVTGEKTLDASGGVVAPGFIDIHTHYDAQVFWDSTFTPSCFHGVTTVVAGNCGFSLAPTRFEHRDLISRTLEKVEDMNLATLNAGIPWDFSTFPEYMSSVKRRGTALNFASYVGHSALRIFAMGDDAYERAATPDELATMKRALTDAMHAGATGFSTSFVPIHRGADGKPVPSRFSTRSELDELLGVMRDGRRGVVAIAVGDECPVEDLYELQPKLGLPLTYVALLAEESGQHRKYVDLHNEAWERGIEVFPQVSNRPITFEFSLASPFNMSANPAFAELGNSNLAERRRTYADLEWRQRAAKGFGGGGTFAFTPLWDSYQIEASQSHPDFVGKKLVEIAASRGLTPFEAMLDLALDEGDLALRIKAMLINYDVDEVTFLLSQENCALGLSDAGAHINSLCDAPQATDLLGKWVRERGVMSVETAVRRLSGAQADLFGFADRGYIRHGFAADVVVFDPATVDPGPTVRVRDFPADGERLTAPTPVGVQHVLVNGTPIRVDGEQAPSGVAAHPGQMVRPTD
ncbi:amidohydrolase family protein [Rhodococcus opacus]|nr:amidohydrolase family protein [Rhodococcus opacus]